MKAEDIVVVHLSDLHISRKEGLRQLHKDLLQDLAFQISDASQLVVAVTGDIVDQGDVDGAKGSVLEFFEELNKALALSEKRKLLYFGVTPGNHDCKKPKKENKFNANTFCPDSSAFKALLADIYKIFGLESEGLYGVSVKEYDGRKICFARIDSSWHDREDKLRKRLEEGFAHADEVDEKLKLMQEKIRKEADRQRCDIIKQWEKRFGQSFKEEPYLTFVLSHLPLAWMGETSTGDLHSFLSGRGFSSVNFWLCGHLHSAKIRHVQDNGVQMTTLMSGVGTEESGSYAQRYSIYRLSLERNVCSVQIRVSHSGRGFIDDLNIGTDVSEYENRHIVMPLKPDKTTSIMPLHTTSAGRVCCCYMDRVMVNLMKKTQVMVLGIERDIHKRVDNLTNSVIGALAKKGKLTAQYISSWVAGSLDVRKLDDIRKLARDDVAGKVLFHELLKGICTDVREAIVNNSSGMRASCPIWRVHFRKYVGCIDAKKLIKDKFEVVAIADDHTTEDDLNAAKDVKWGGLIKAAFLHEDKVLINSANPKLNEIETRWDDFMTAIPVPDINKWSFLCCGTTSMQFEIRPMLTFGISMMAEGFHNRMEASRILYLLEFFNLADVVSNGIKVALSRIGNYDAQSFKELVNGCKSQ